MSQSAESISRNMFGIQICAETMSAAVARVHEAISLRTRLDIGVVNAAKIVNMQRNKDLFAAVAGSDVIYADGKSVVWASRFLNKPLPERVAGIDLMTGILEKGNEAGYRVFCLGSTEAILEAVCQKFSEMYPGVSIVGSHHGYFDESGEEAVARQIQETKPDVLFVAITSPKKEQFMSRWAEFMGVTVVHGVGGSFDVVAGLVDRAPESWQRLGFEWLYRVKQEPRRLWKRYLVTNSIFLGMLVREFVYSWHRKTGKD